jgi:NAD(P)-dependent dehydrogenase (short-subunit alcohol dehydrogenase family)
MSDNVRDLKNKVIVVTGAGSGIGRALVLDAARRGMRVVLADIDAVRLAEVTQEARALGAQAMGVEVDVGSAESVEQLAKRAFSEFGAVHVLVNNAGIASSGAAWTVPLQTWKKVLDINLNGVIYGVHSFVQRMIESGQPGHVVNVASTAGLISSPGFAAYSASKFAVVGLTEALYHDLKVRKLNVSASVLCPSWVQTRIANDGVVDAAADLVDAKVNAAVSKAVEHGISAESVAETVLRAVENDQFYIITHDETLRAVAHRTEDILAQRSPTLAVVDRKRP